MVEEGRDIDSLPFDPDDKHEFGFGRNIVASILLAETRETDLFSFGVAVLFDICFGSFENHTAFFFSGLCTVRGSALLPDIV